MKIAISGETLENNGVFPCLVNGDPSIILKNFKGKTYSYTIDAIGYANERLFTRSSSFKVDGNIKVTADLTAVAGSTSYGYLTWTFPAMVGAPNPDCATAGVSDVLVSIDGAAEEKIPCALGFGTNPGVQTPLLAPGQHTIVLTGVDSVGYAYYRAYSTLTTTSANPVAATYALPWAVGGTAVKWTITDGSIGQDCAMAGVTDVYINFVDSGGNLVYGSLGDKKPCSSAGVEYPFLKPGTYEVRIDAAGTGNRKYRSNYTTPPLVTIVAGQFVPMNAAVNVTVFRTQ